VRGLAAIEEFVQQGGTLIVFDAASELPVEYFPLPLRNAIRPGAGAFQCPGSLLRITVDTAHPLAAGMPEEAVAFVIGGQAWDVTLPAEYNRGGTGNARGGPLCQREAARQRLGEWGTAGAGGKRP
jgi:hypothetical protein